MKLPRNTIVYTAYTFYTVSFFLSRVEPSLSGADPESCQELKGLSGLEYKWIYFHLLILTFMVTIIVRVDIVTRIFRGDMVTMIVRGDIVTNIVRGNMIL